MTTYSRQPLLLHFRDRAEAADGKRFLMNSGNLKEGTEHFMLVQNWTADFEDAIQGASPEARFRTAVV